MRHEKSQKQLGKWCALAGVLCLLFGSLGSGEEAQGKRPKAAKAKRGKRVSRRRVRKAPKVRRAGALRVTKPRDKAEARAIKRLTYRINRALRYPKLRGARIGVLVMTAKGRVLYAKNARKKFIPASNLKLLTIATALKVLGYHYRFKTTVFSDAPIGPKGVLKGNLYIKGGGDPSFRSEELWRVVRDLWMKGLRKVTGRVIFDNSVFDRKRFGKGWTDHSNQPKEKYRPYLAPIGGLALNYSTIAISARPGLKLGEPARISIDPWGRYIRKIINKSRTVAEGGKFKLRFRILPFRGYRDAVEVRGTVPMGADSRSYWRRINFPGWYAAFQFASFLQQQKIKVSSWPKRGRVPINGRNLYTHFSQPLGQILQYVGKQSSNFTSEQVLKMVGARKYRRPGTWRKGLRAMRDYLKTLGIAPKDYVVYNGSGLSRGNQISPEQFAIVLKAMLGRYSMRSEYLAAQATSGQDGTLRWRMKDRISRGKIRGKTGTLDGVSSLSGYALTRKNKILIFSILMNGRIWQGRYFRMTQNRIGRILARYPKL